MTTFTQEVRAALDAPDAATARLGVHETVATHLRWLDPSAQIELTGYFNHSSVPDFVLTWEEDGTEGLGRYPLRRQVFLRHNLQSSRAAGDLNTFARPETTVYLSLDAHEPEEEVALARKAAATHPMAGPLMTTVSALEALDPPAGTAGPLLPLVQEVFLRQARGAVFSDDVKALLANPYR